MQKLLPDVLITTFFTLLLCATVHAQDVGVKLDNLNTDRETTISIKKGDAIAKKKYTISEGNEDIGGEKDVLKKNAEKNWKKACDEWKFEMKTNNKDNKIISLSCGVMTCSKDGVESACQSKATYKIRVLAEE